MDLDKIIGWNYAIISFRTPQALKDQGWRLALGPALTIFFIALHYVLDQSTLWLFDPAAFVVLPIVFAAFTGGLRSSLISVAIAVFYLAYAFSIASALFRFRESDLRSLIIWGATLLVLALLVSGLRRRILTSLRKGIRDAEEAERVRRGDDRRLKSILNSAYDAFIAINEQGRIIEWNLQAESSLGWKRDEVIDKDLVDIVIPKRYRDEHLRGFRQFLDGGKGPILNKRIEISAMHKHGFEVPVELAVTPVAVGDHYVFGAILRDISEKRLSQKFQELQLSVTRILNEVHQFPEMARRILESICRIMNWDVGMLWVKDGEELAFSSIWFPSRSISLQSFAESCRSMTFKPGEGLAGKVLESGKTLWLSGKDYDPGLSRALFAARSELHGALAFPVVLDSSIYGVLEFHSQDFWDVDEKLLGIMADIGIQIGMYAERKKVEKELRDLYLQLENRVEERSRELAEKNQDLIREVEEHRRTRADLEQQKNRAEAASLAKTAFLANMSHEIRTPLGAVIGFSELLMNPDVSASEKVNFQAIIKRNGDVVCRVINDILDLSKVEAGKLTIEKTETSIHELLNDVSILLNLLASEKGIGFSLTSEGGIPDLIETDPLRLRQILVNVVGNAIKFTQKGFVEVTVKKIPGANGRDKIAFIIQDTGKGIAPEDAERIFEPFTQADASMTRKFGGSGLGLPLARRLAQLLGGSIEISRTEIGKGSVFTVTVDPGQAEGSIRLQSRPDRSAEFGKANLRVVPDPLRLDGLKILLVEDAPDIQMLVSRMLRLGGATCDVADNGALGVERAMNGDYDVLLVDLQMPIMDGYETVRTLRARGYRGQVIALTAHALKEERIKCLESGFDDHLIKPVDRIRLFERLVRCKRRGAFSPMNMDFSI